MPEDMPEGMPDRMSDRMPVGMPDKVRECLPDRMPEDLPDRMPDRVSEDMPEDMPDRVPEDVPEQNAEDMPDRMPEDMPDRMPEDMPDKMPEGMSDRMPEDLPVTKCINVMVGITRSKLIHIQIWFFEWMLKFMFWGNYMMQRHMCIYYTFFSEDLTGILNHVHYVDAAISICSNFDSSALVAAFSKQSDEFDLLGARATWEEDMSIKS